MGKTGKKIGRLRVFPTFHKFFHKGVGNGTIFISVNIKIFDKMELFSLFFVIAKMNKGKFWCKKFPLDKAILYPNGVFFKRTCKNFKKGIDFQEKKGYNG